MCQIIFELLLKYLLSRVYKMGGWADGFMGISDSEKHL